MSRSSVSFSREFVDQVEPAAVGLVGEFEDGAIRLHAVQSHAGGTDDQVVVLVEGKAERSAADACEKLSVLEVRAGEAQDPALPRTGVKAALAVQDDVLRSLYLVDRDRLRPAEAGIHRIRRSAALPRIG